MLFCGLLTMWSIWGYEWLGLVCWLLEGFSTIRNLYNNFLLYIHVVQFLFYIFIFYLFNLFIFDILVFLHLKFVFNAINFQLFSLPPPLQKLPKWHQIWKVPLRCIFSLLIFSFPPTSVFSIGFLKFVDDMPFCGLSTMWSLWGYEWLGLVCRLLEGFSRIKNIYNNFLLYIHVVQFLFYIFVFTHSICLSLKY